MGLKVTISDPFTGPISTARELTLDDVGPIVAPASAALGDKSYDHIQGSSSTTWTINHNLGKHPSIVVIDSAGNVIEGDPTYPTLNQVIIHFSAAFSGKAYLN
jgi:hypothetical protein